MLNNQENQTFADSIRALSIEGLREKESELIEIILRHYDELKPLIEKRVNPKEYTMYNTAIARDTEKLQAIRAEINHKFQTSLLNTTETIFQNDGEDKIFDENTKLVSPMCQNGNHQTCFHCGCQCHD